jgi:hypothetical protein
VKERARTRKRREERRGKRETRRNIKRREEKGILTKERKKERQKKERKIDKKRYLSLSLTSSLLGQRVLCTSRRGTAECTHRCPDGASAQPERREKSDGYGSRDIERRGESSDRGE